MNAIDISLYAIIDPNRSRDRDLADLVTAAARGGVTLVQYRDKGSETRELIETARRLKTALDPFSIPLLINDRVDVAQASGVAGVHLGQSDMAIEDARRILGPEAFIGLTIKNADQARAAPVRLIDYACIGGVYQTLSKENPTAIGIEGWRKAAAPLRERAPGLPVGAIAGIDADNMKPLLDVGVDGVAVISALFMTEDAEKAAGDLKQVWMEHRP